MENNEQICPEPTFMYLLELKEKRNQKNAYAKIEKERIDLALSFDICPTCGCPLIREDIEVLNPPISRFTLFPFSLIQRKKLHWDFRRICSNNKEHYEYKYDDDYSGY